MDSPETKKDGERQIFISYSRSEMYYAEEVAQEMQLQGFNVWFDLQRLEPGCNWAEEIEKGLHASTEIVLIVSQTALQSPYVAKEWLHAIEEGKAIHLVMFEAASFEPIVAQLGSEEMAIPLDELKSKAQNILDGRRNFNRMIEQLTMALNDPAHSIKADIGKPNPYGINLAMPPVVALIPIALTILILYLFWAINYLLDAMWRLGLRGNNTFFSGFVVLSMLLIIGIVGLELYNFLRRKSYRGTRITLLVSTIFLFFFSMPMTVILAIAGIVSISSRDVSRWSPRGEAARRDESNWEVSKRFIYNSLWWYRRFAAYNMLFKGILIVLLLFVGYLLAFEVSPAYWQWAPRNRLWLAPGIILLLATVLGMFYSGEHISPYLRTSNRGDKTFRIINAHEDTNIALKVAQEMKQAGAVQKQGAADYTIIIASQYLRESDIANLESDVNLIVVLVSTLGDLPWISKLQDYQWIDYRKQDEEQLMMMVNDLWRTDQDSITSKYSTRTTPQSFNNIVIPWSVQLFTIVQLVALYFMIAILAIALTTTFRWSTFAYANIVYYILTGILGIYLVTRVMHRDITVNQIVLLNTIQVLGLYALNQYFTFIDLPRGVEFGDMIPTMIAGLVGIGIGYYAARSMISNWLGAWLPTDNTPPLLSPMFKKYSEIYIRSIVTGVVVIFITLLFFLPSPRGPFISHILLESNNPISEQVAIAFRNFDVLDFMDLRANLSR